MFEETAWRGGTGIKYDRPSQIATGGRESLLLV